MQRVVAVDCLASSPISPKLSVIARDVFEGGRVGGAGSPPGGRDPGAGTSIVSDIVPGPGGSTRVDPFSCAITGSSAVTKPITSTS